VHQRPSAFENHLTDPRLLVQGGLTPPEDPAIEKAWALLRYSFVSVPSESKSIRTATTHSLLAASLAASGSETPHPVRCQQQDRTATRFVTRFRDLSSHLPTRAPRTAGSPIFPERAQDNRQAAWSSSAEPDFSPNHHPQPGTAGSPPPRTEAS
jgi:hypothetical protein